MKREGHITGCIATTLFIGIVAQQSVPEVLICTASAVPFSQGRLSPDIDVKGIVREVFGHRNTLHWIGWPLAAIGFCFIFLHLPYVLTGPLQGWLSHLFPCDFFWGKQGWGISRGIPLMPWRGGGRLGMNWKVSGPFFRYDDRPNSGHSAGELAGTVGFGVLALLELWYLVMMR